MTEDEKMQVAVFRFGIISDFVMGALMSRAEKGRLMRDKCARKWQIPFSEKTRIYEMPDRARDIDAEIDFKFVEFIIKEGFLDAGKL